MVTKGENFILDGRTIKQHIYNIRTYILDQEDIRGDIELPLRIQNTEEEFFLRPILHDDAKVAQKFFDNACNPNTKLSIKRISRLGRLKRRSIRNKRIIQPHGNSKTRFEYRVPRRRTYHPFKLGNGSIQSSSVCASDNAEKTVASSRSDDAKQLPQYGEHVPPDKETLELLENVRRKYEDELYRDHKNLNFISGSSVKVGKHGTQKRICLVLYCSKKGFIPDGEEPFPKTLHFEGKYVDVDVREGNRMIPVMDRETPQRESKHGRVQMGTIIRRTKNTKEGTVGPFVQMSALKTGFLTCAHVLCHIGRLEGKLPLGESEELNEILDKEKCGIIRSAHFVPSLGVDVAVVEIMDSKAPTKGEFRQTSQGGGSTAHSTFNSGKILNKKALKELTGPFGKVNPLILGGSSGSKTGRLHHEDLAGSTRLMFDKGERIMKEVYLVTTFEEPFICSGESGSGVFVEHQDELHCIGLAISCDPKGMYGCVTPIDNVLGVVKNDLKRFET